MKKVEIKGYEILINSDSVEGRGHMITYAYASNLSTANEIAKGKDTMGSDGTVRPINKTIEIFDTHQEFLDSKKEDKRQAALNKLTSEDKEILGLK